MKTALLAGALGLFAATAAVADVTGTWQTEPGNDGYLHVEIANCGDALCGTIAKAFQGTGAMSPDYEHLGKRMIWDMKSDGDGAYSGGRVWAPDKDKTYRSKMSLSGNELTVKGCVAGGAICRGQTWTRVN